MFFAANLFKALFISFHKVLLVALVAHLLRARWARFGRGSAGFLSSSRLIARTMLRTAGFQFPIRVHLASSRLTGPLMNGGNLMPLRKSCVQPGNDILASTGLETVADFLS